MEAKKDVIPFSSSPLTALLQGALGLDSRVMVIFTLGPTSLTADVTRATLKQSVRVANIHGRRHSEQHEEVKNTQLKLKSVLKQLAAMKVDNASLEQSVAKMQTIAGEVVGKFDARNETIVKHFLDEKEKCKQLQSDLELTSKTLKRTVAELRDQRSINQRLVEILRALEKERQELL
jgi:hypothetical protein